MSEQHLESLPANLGDGRVLVDTRATGAAPRTSAGFSDDAPIGSAEAGAVLCRQRVRDESLVAESSSCAPASAVEHRAGVGSSVRGDAEHLGGVAVHEHSGDWKADDRNASDGVVFGDRDGEQSATALRCSVVTMYAVDEGLRLGQRDRRQAH
jgi:hypothetical protein